MIIGPFKSGDLVDRPGERRTQSFPAHRSTGFADGHQPMECPLLRTALLQLAHEQAVRRHDQVDVPGLALDITQLGFARAVVGSMSVLRRTAKKLAANSRVRAACSGLPGRVVKEL